MLFLDYTVTLYDGTKRNWMVITKDLDIEVAKKRQRSYFFTVEDTAPYEEMTLIKSLDYNEVRLAKLTDLLHFFSEHTESYLDELSIRY